MINRRGLLFGLMAAPAIVKAENLMKIVVPKKRIITPHIMDMDVNSMYARPFALLDDQPFAEFKHVVLRVNKRPFLDPITFEPRLEFFLEQKQDNGEFVFQRSLLSPPLLPVKDAHSQFRAKNLVGPV